MAVTYSLDGLIKWTRRDEWRDAFSDLVNRHLGPACSGAEVNLEELADLIGDHWFRILWGCAFEDLVSRTLDDGRNIADDYLKRRGRKETPATRHYIAALRSSVVSVSEASGIAV